MGTFESVDLFGQMRQRPERCIAPPKFDEWIPKTHVLEHVQTRLQKMALALKVINSLIIRGGTWRAIFLQIQIKQPNDSLTCQGDEERQLGIPVSPMCELGTPRVS